MTAATAPQPDAHRADAVLPRWLPWLFLALLVLPFHPYWLDFEQVRRGLLVALFGLRLVVMPRPAARPASDTTWILVAALAVVIGHAGTGLPGLVYLLALLQLASLGALYDRRAWLVPVAWLLLLTAAFGLAQRLGVGEFAGYGTIGEPVSVFGNLNVAAEFAAVAAAATLALGLERPRLALAALAVAGAYCAVNASRSSALALLPAAAWFWFAVPGTPARKGALLLALALGAGAGFAITACGPRPAVTIAPGARAPVENRGGATALVRLEIGKSCWHMFRGAPLLGHGLGQFEVQYPRYRSQDEIEASSLHRQFASRVPSAHDDWLQVLVEGGLPSLLAWLWTGVLALRQSRGDRARVLPLVAFAVLMIVRSPLGNAPCAAVAFAVGFGAGGAAPPVARWRRPWLARAAGALLLLWGLQPLLLNQRFAPYQDAVAHGRPGEPAVLERVNGALLADPRVDHLLAQEYRDAGRLDDALAAVDRALDAWPHEPTFHLLRAEILVLRGNIDGAKAALAQAAALDPGNPQLIVQYVAIYFMQRDHDAAVTLLYHDPHPVLFAEIAKNCDEFARLSAARKDAAGERRWRAEACLRRALDSTGAGDRQEQALANERFRLAKDTCAQAGMQKDPRVFALIALLALDAADPPTAEKAAANLAEPLQAWQVSALGRENAAHLRRLGSWRPLLP